MSAPGLLLVERTVPGCAVVTLNRPHVLNALSLDLRRTLVAAFEALAADRSVCVVVLTGAGRAFCAGLDLKELQAAGPSSLLAPDVANVTDAIARFGGPVIAAVNGPAYTGGMEVALACDVLIASTQAVLADTHARVGVLPGWGLSQRLARIVGASRAKEFSLAGMPMDAAQAERWGVVNRVVAPEELLPAALDVARRMLAAPPGILPAYKRLIDDGLALPLGEALRLERARSAEWSSSLAAVRGR